MTDLGKLQAAMHAGDQDAAAGALKLTPTQRLHEVTLAALTRRERASSLETVSVKHATTGTQAGNIVLDDLTVPRHDGETDDQWIQRFQRTLNRIHLAITEENTDAYRMQADVVTKAKR